MKYYLSSKKDLKINIKTAHKFSLKIDVYVGIFCCLYKILNWICFPFVSLSFWMKKKFPIFNTAMRKSVISAVAKRINGEKVAPSVPTIFIHPKLTDVISAGYNSAMNTKNIPQTAFNVILKHPSTIISKIVTTFTWLFWWLSMIDRIPNNVVKTLIRRKDIWQYFFL